MKTILITLLFCQISLGQIRFNNKEYFNSLVESGQEEKINYLILEDEDN